jgi:uncharacterized membrane protein YdbT with pleckstrin-like domain
MSYIENNLLTGESIVYRGKLSRAVFVPAITTAVIIILVGLGGGDAAVFAGMLFLFLVLPMAGSAAVNLMTAEFGVTNKRVIMKYGFIGRTSAEILLTKIEAIGVEQGVVGRIFNYGTIVVSGTGGTKTPFPRISSPIQFRKAVQEQIEKASK